MGREAYRATVRSVGAPRAPRSQPRASTSLTPPFEGGDERDGRHPSERATPFIYTHETRKRRFSFERRDRRRWHSGPRLSAVRHSLQALLRQSWVRGQRLPPKECLIGSIAFLIAGSCLGDHFLSCLGHQILVAGGLQKEPRHDPGYMLGHVARRLPVRRPPCGTTPGRSLRSSFHWASVCSRADDHHLHRGRKRSPAVGPPGKSRRDRPATALP